MGKIAVTGHVLGFIPGHPGQLPVGRQGLQPVFRPDLVDQPDYLAFVLQHGVRHLGDGQDLAGVDEVGILYLGIGGDDLAGAHPVFHRQLPHGVARSHGMAESGGGRGDGEGSGQQGGCCGGGQFLPMLHVGSSLAHGFQRDE